MILSVSRRTDIPNYYSEWFLNRIKEGYLYVRNPFHARQVSKITVSPERVDCIVFWTKNPEPMFSRLDELDAYPYYFQFTLTGYGRDIESHIPHKKKVMIPIFQTLSDRIGREKVIWRYDPILFTDRYSPQYHIRAFEQIAKELHGYTSKCVLSFVDLYAKNKKSMEELRCFSLTEQDLTAFAAEIAQIADRYGMRAASCAEAADWSSVGIEHSCCIDKELIEHISGCKIRAGKDRNQRNECGCIESIDVGAYDTCRNGCRYCYANDSPERVLQNCRLYDAHSPLLCGSLTKDDRMTERDAKSWKENQLTLWEL
ncbi:DUF1848 domain-containing protein [Clostridiaceae bacterium]|nr:DUF1848 domain-containing protein [Clostridiaceae bacterium]